MQAQPGVKEAMTHPDSLEVKRREEGTRVRH